MTWPNDAIVGGAFLFLMLAGLMDYAADRLDSWRYHRRKRRDK
jgi:hypothetical protein